MAASAKNRLAFWPLLLILAAMTVLVWMAPQERTLGFGIKPVYVHVSLTWVGMLAFLLSALLSLVGVISGRPATFSWLWTIFRVAFIFYLAGFLVSLLASYVNWGGVPLQEPRLLAALNVLVVSAVAGGLLLWLPWTRLSSLLGIIPSLIILFSVQSSRMVLHPDNPVSSAPPGIRYSFLGMFALALLLAVWLAWGFRQRAAQAA